MQPDLTDHYILVTGAGRGLGRHVAEHLAGCGAVIAAVDIDRPACEETVARIEATGRQAQAYGGDVADPAVFMAIADGFAQQAGRIDVIVNNAMVLKYGPVQNVENTLLSTMLDVGIKPVFWAAQALLKHKDASRGAVMINMASPVVNRGYPNTSAYTATKCAIAGLTRVLAAELGPQGIRVNAVSPASVPTPGALGIVPREEYERRIATIPLRRLGTEADNSNAIAMLLSPEMYFVNGEIFNIDGGVAASM
ncbi:MAG: SDR family oxidoreductase [Pseudomonadales bacterium]|nr:SDR family oxidoreductase [Pseudomonadales bacterium]